MVPRFSFQFIYKDLSYSINIIGIYPKTLCFKFNKLKAIEKITNNTNSQIRNLQSKITAK